MGVIDLGPAAEQLGELVAGVTDEQLSRPTPCPAYSLRELIAHVAGLPIAFGAAGRKERNAITDTPPSPEAPPLAPDFRAATPAALRELAALWRDPGTWDGMTRIAGMDMPADAVGVTLADELVVHAWDIATALGRSYDADPAALAAAQSFLDMVVSEDAVDGPSVAFGPPKPAPADASVLERVVALAGRDARWVPSGA